MAMLNNQRLCIPGNTFRHLFGGSACWNLGLIHSGAGFVPLGIAGLTLQASRAMMTHEVPLEEG